MMDQYRFGDLAGVSNCLISHVEAGRRIPTILTLVEICRNLGEPVTRLIQPHEVEEVTICQHCKGYGKVWAPLADPDQIKESL